MTTKLYSTRRMALASMTMALVQGCSASPGEHVSVTSSAVGAEGQSPSEGVSYTLTISEIDVNEANELPSALSLDPGYSEWGQFGARVDHLDPVTNQYVLGQPYATACSFGKVQTGSKLTGCPNGGAYVDGLWTSGRTLSMPITVMSPTDRVVVGMALDNTEQATPNSDSYTAFLGTFGNGLQATGGVITLAAGSTAAGAAWAAGPIVGLIGSVIAMIASDPPSSNNPLQVYTCAGGLMGNPSGTFNPQPNKPLNSLDSAFISLSPQQLENMTLGGTADYPWNVSVTPGELDKQPYCTSSHTIHLQVVRDWTTGPAPSPKSGDSATIDFLNGNMPTSATSTPASEIDTFWTGLAGTTIDRRFDRNGAWLSTFGAQGDSLVTPTWISSISRAPGYVDAFWVNQNGTLETAAWEPNRVTTQQHTVMGAGFVAPDAHVSVAARTPNSLDLFYIGSNGALDTNWWNAAGGAWSTMSPISATGIAPSGGGAAAVARRNDTEDVLFTGTDGEVYWSFWSSETGWVTRSIAPAGTATTGVGSITMVAQSTNQLDAFFAGANGAVYRSSWSQATAAQPNYGWTTTAVTGAGVVWGGTPISAVSRAPGSIDVAFLAGAIDLISLKADGTFTAPTAITPNHVQGPVSLVAANSGQLDVFYNDALMNQSTAHLNAATQTWSTSTVPSATTNIGGLFTLGNAVGNCLDVWGASAQAGAEIDSTTCNNTVAQRFAFGNDGRIVSTTNASLCVDYTVSSRVALAPCGGPNQVFEYIQGQLVTNYGACLDVQYDNPNPSVQVDVANCNGTRAQFFLPFGIPTLIEASSLGAPSPMCIGTNPQGDVMQTCGNWLAPVTIDAQGEVASSLGCLEAVPGTQTVELATCGAGSTMQWVYMSGLLQPRYDVSQGVSDCLDVHYASPAVGTPVDYCGCNGTKAQVWTFTQSLPVSGPTPNTAWPWAMLP